MDTPVDSRIETTDCETPKPRRLRIEHFIVAVLVVAAGAVGYQLLASQHGREMATIHGGWQVRMGRMEARAMAAENLLGDRNTRVANLSSELAKVTKEMDGLREQLSAAELNFANELATRADRDDQIAALNETLTAHRAQLTKLGEDLSARQQQIATLTAAITAERAQARRTLAEANDLNATLQRQLDGILDDYTKALAEADTLRKQLDESKDAYARAEAYAADTVERLLHTFPQIAQGYVRVTPGEATALAATAASYTPHVEDPRSTPAVIFGPSCEQGWPLCEGDMLFQTVADDASIAQSN